MEMVLPEKLEAVLGPLFKVVPLESAMPLLVVTRPPRDTMIRLVKEVVHQKEIAALPGVVAGLWLYVDDLDASHRISQQHEGDATMNFWHAIMHRREGDFSNSKYWFRRVGVHPAMAQVSKEYEPMAYVDLVAAAQRRGPASTPPELLELQRREWGALFRWCAEQ